MTLTGLSLFAGALDGLGVAFEACGGEIVGQVEIDAYCTAVLEKHWPQVRRMRDIKEVQDGEFGPVDVIIASPPCQPISSAGKRRGAADGRWLWPEFFRVLGLYRPRWVVAENPRGLFTTSAGLLFRGILGTFTDMGYRVGWCCYGADAVGAPHRRERIFLIAHRVAESPAGSRQEQPRGAAGAALGRALAGTGSGTGTGDGAPRVGQPRGVNATSATDLRSGSLAHAGGEQSQRGRGPGHMAGAAGAREGAEEERQRLRDATGRGCAAMAHTEREQGGERHEPDMFWGWTEPAQQVGLGGGRGETRRGTGEGQALTSGNGWDQGRATPAGQQGRSDAALSDAGVGLAHAHHAGCHEQRQPEPAAQEHAASQCGGHTRRTGTIKCGVGVPVDGRAGGLVCRDTFAGWPARPGEVQHDWEEPRLIYGTVPDRTKQLKALGNGVVWLQALPIFEAIVEVEHEREERNEERMAI